MHCTLEDKENSVAHDLQFSLVLMIRILVFGVTPLVSYLLANLVDDAGIILQFNNASHDVLPLT